MRAVLASARTLQWTCLCTLQLLLHGARTARPDKPFTVGDLTFPGINLPDELGETALYAVAGLGELRDVAFVIKSGAIVDLENDKGQTALRAACALGRVSNARYLIKHGADINHRDHRFYTPLMHATLGLCTNREACDDPPSADMVRLLLQHGAGVNDQTIDGISALSFAAGNGHLDILQVLLEFGADVELKDLSGLTARDHCDDYNLESELSSHLHQLDFEPIPCDVLEEYGLLSAWSLRSGALLLLSTFSVAWCVFELASNFQKGGSSERAKRRAQEHRDKIEAEARKADAAAEKAAAEKVAAEKVAAVRVKEEFARQAAETAARLAAGEAAARAERQRARRAAEKKAHKEAARQKRLEDEEKELDDIQQELLALKHSLKTANPAMPMAGR